MVRSSANYSAEEGTAGTACEGEGSRALVAAVDVCVYGATPSGIAAAIAARREGCSVLLLEPKAWIGGMVSGGIGRTDVDEGMSKALVVGFADEFFGAIAKEDYHRSWWVIS